jgi:hypothetical protein
MRPFILLSSAWLLTIAASAQTSSPVRSSATSSGGLLGGVITPAGSVASGAGWTLSSVGPEVPGYTATGAPYSAVQITEHTQTLADGTHITQPVQTTKFYRDSQGRTRIERSFPVPPGALANGTDAPSFIEISDPVAGFRYTLEARNHTAHRMAMAATPPPSVTANNGSPAKTIRLLPAQITPLSPSAPSDQTTGPQFSHESLGTQAIEGILAEGSRTTITYPIGSVGNDRPITTTTETWTSSELRMAVLSKNSDPRNGESTTRLANISRSEPDSSLFQIPSDYEVIDQQIAVPKQ